MRIFEPCVYIMASGRNGTTYIGVTSNLIQRVHQHRDGTFRGFSSERHCTRLVWFERHETMETVIQREKRIKKRNRDWKAESGRAGQPPLVRPRHGARLRHRSAIKPRSISRPAERP